MNGKGKARSTAGVQGLPDGTEECGCVHADGLGREWWKQAERRKGGRRCRSGPGRERKGVNLGRVGRGGCWARVRGNVGGLGCWFWAGEKEREWPDGDWVGFSHGLVSSFGFSFYF